MMRSAVYAALAAVLLLAPASAVLADGEGPRCLKQGRDIETHGADADDLADFAEDCVHLNQVQVLGSHNSYHEQPAPSLDWLLENSDPLVPGCETSPEPCPSELAIVWEYTHVPLDQQFATQGVRQVELDVFLDPLGIPVGHILPQQPEETFNRDERTSQIV